MGTWVEDSKDLHAQLGQDHCIYGKVAAKARSLGREISYNELGIVIAQVRK